VNIERAPSTGGNARETGAGSTRVLRLSAGIFAVGFAIISLYPLTTASSHGALGRGSDPTFTVIAIPDAVRESMNAIFVRYNEHWDELTDVNTLTQMLGTGRPTQREYLGCLRGHVSHDTLWVTDWAPAREMKQLQFAVAGSCDDLTDVVGTWHTHPYRADLRGAAIKESSLSQQDLATFTAGRDRVVLIVWDVDSFDAAARGAGGAVLHPALVVFY